VISVQTKLLVERRQPGSYPETAFCEVAHS